MKHDFVEIKSYMYKMSFKAQLQRKKTCLTEKKKTQKHKKNSKLCSLVQLLKKINVLTRWSNSYKVKNIRPKLMLCLLTRLLNFKILTAYIT